MDAQFVLEYVKKTQLETKKFNILLDVDLNPKNKEFIDLVKNEWSRRLMDEFDPSRVLVTFGAITTTGDSQIFNYKYVGQEIDDFDPIQDEENILEIPFSSVIFFDQICGSLEGLNPDLYVENGMLKMEYNENIVGIVTNKEPNQDIFQKVLEWFNRVDAYGKLQNLQLEYPLLTKNSIFHDDFDSIFWTDSNVSYVKTGNKTIIMKKQLVDLLLAINICNYYGCDLFVLYACHYLFRKFYLMTPQEKKDVSSMNNLFVPCWKEVNNQVFDWISTLLMAFNENEFRILFEPFLNNIFPNILDGRECCDTLPEKTIQEFVENKFLFTMS